MANKIQIKRSTANAIVSGLANGELAFTQASNTLHIGLPDGSGVLRIGGAQYPGTLTNSHALVANSTGGVNKVITGNLVVDKVYANGAFGTSGQLLASDNTGNTYWVNPSTLTTSAAGNNTQVQFNNGNLFAASAGFTFNSISNNVSVGNTISSLVSTANTVTVTGTTVSSNTTTGALIVAGGAGIAGRINAADLAAGNDSVYSTLTGTTLTTANVHASETVNASVLSVGTNFIANTSRVTVGSGVGFSANGSLGSANQVLRSNGSSIYWADDVGDISGITAGNGLSGGGTSGDITVNVLANNGVLANTSGVWAVAANGISVDSSGINVVGGNGLVANSTGVHIGQGNGISVSADAIRVQQANGIAVNAGGVYVDAAAGLVANATGLHVGAGNGISVSADAVGVSAGTDGGLISNTTGVWVKAGTGVTVNSTGVSIGQPIGTTDNVTFANVVTTKLTATGNVQLGDSSADIVSFGALVNTHFIPSANLTYSVGSNTLRWNEVHAGNVHGVEGHFDSSVYVGGDIFVTGNLVTTNVQSVVISDPMIYLAGNNYTSDLVDIGFAANYFDGVTERHTGLYRDFTDGEYKLFTNSEQELSGNNHVNAAANGYTLAVLHTYLVSGGLSTNSTSANLVANSTFAVGIVANTLTLSTALAGTEGGTGWKNTVSQSILVGNTSNGYDRLALGTSGYVLQSNGSALVYDVLDGGSF